MVRVEHRQSSLRCSIPVTNYSSSVLLSALIDVHALTGSWELQMTLPRSAELRWQKEIIEVWLNIADVPLDAKKGLLEMLQTVKEEIEKLHLSDQTN